MRARADLTVFHEPFSVYYYLSRERSTERFAGGAQTDPAHDWRTILDKLLRAGEERQVFFKDMAYHVSGCMTPELVKSFRHAFLIRHPRHTLPSLLKKLPDFTLEEAGFEQQHRLMRVVIEACPDELVVIDGEELRRSPEAVVERFSRKVGLDFRPEALSWKPGLVADWERWRDWHTEVANSTGIEPPDPPRESAPGRPYDGISEEVYSTCLGHFEQMVELAGAGNGGPQAEDATPRA
jgi:hypothetical protein